MGRAYPETNITDGVLSFRRSRPRCREMSKHYHTGFLITMPGVLNHIELSGFSIDMHALAAETA
jgi:hypothetical protein